MNFADITDYIFIEDNDQNGDVAIVFGTWNSWHDSIIKTAKLYQAGLVPKIIFSGGKNRNTGIIDGEAMASEAIKQGVLEKDILVENQATNTLENVLFSREILDRQIGLKNIKVVTAVVKNYHARRALMTLKKHLPTHIQLKAAVYASSYNFTNDDWHLSAMGKRKVLAELEKIKMYLAKGDLAEL